jgi:hypothetical protein
VGKTGKGEKGRPLPRFYRLVRGGKGSWVLHSTDRARGVIIKATTMAVSGGKITAVWLLG